VFSYHEYYECLKIDFVYFGVLLQTGLTGQPDSDASLQLQSQSGSAFHPVSAPYKHQMVGGYEAPVQSDYTMNQGPASASQSQQGSYHHF
jgi:hypothetical protein